MKRREDALRLLYEYVKSESLRNHCKSVAVAMEAYARKFIREGRLKINNKNNAVDEVKDVGDLTEVQNENHNCSQEEKEEIDKWWMCGMLHDFDYERFPSLEQHPFEGVKILKGEGYDEEIVQAILGHGNHTNVERGSLMAKTLFSVDELCGLITALSKVRPNKFDGMTADSVKKAMKKKDFAAGINRHEIMQGISELGVNENEHFELVIGVLR